MMGRISSVAHTFTATCRSRIKDMTLEYIFPAATRQAAATV